MKRHTLVPSLSLCYTPLHELTGPGKSLNATGANFSARRTIVWRNPARGNDAVSRNSRLSHGPNVGTLTRYRQMHIVLLLFWPLPNIGIHNFGIWDMHNLAKAYRSIQNSLPNRRVEDWEASNGHIKDTTRLFHGLWHDAFGLTNMCTAI